MTQFGRHVDVQHLTVIWVIFFFLPHFGRLLQVIDSLIFIDSLMVKIVF